LLIRYSLEFAFHNPLRTLQVEVEWWCRFDSGNVCNHARDVSRRLPGQQRSAGDTFGTHPPQRLQRAMAHVVRFATGTMNDRVERRQLDGK
jgi:hypothetical protein